MPRPKCFSRRHFLLSAGATLAAPYIIPSSALGDDKRPAPSDRITMGCIGVGGRGTVDLNTFLGRNDVQILAVCDPDKGSTRYEDAWHRGMAPAAESIEKRYAGAKASGAYKGCSQYTDFRELLARDDIDAVCIATPDHWHAPIAVAAAKAGKDIYCEKPLSLTVAAGRAMADAVARYGRVFQCGSQRRSSAKCRSSCELVRNGRIGTLKTVKVGLMGGHWIRSNAAKVNDVEPVPEGFDYEMWLGPAAWAPYTFNRCHWNWRWNREYSGGMVTDWGAHYIDMAHWGMGTEETGPIEIEGTGTFPPVTDLWNTPTAFKFECLYANGVKMTVSSGGGGVRFEGTDGWVDLEGGTSPNLANATIGPSDIHLYQSSDQHGNFIECVKTRRRTAAPAEVAHRSITPAHLGNIAMLLGRKLKWDPVAERFIDDTTADRFLSRAMRAPWHL
ncbi:MAG TPA: Gfo/Idh/MocA family oxidoreductase [Planctomycetota bacterium]|jgi:predicted dehydrogenase